MRIFDGKLEKNSEEIIHSSSTSNSNRLNLVKYLTRIALWTSIGAVLAGIERLIPTPLPWIKLGLANGAALVVLYLNGWKSALLVNVLRVIIIALFLGSWSNPSFWLSLSGAVASVPAMAVVKTIGINKISPVGVSATGAWVHMLVQFIVASFSIVRHSSLMVLAGPSLIAAIISGILVGIIAEQLLKRLTYR